MKTQIKYLSENKWFVANGAEDVTAEQIASVIPDIQNGAEWHEITKEEAALLLAPFFEERKLQRIADAIAEYNAIMAPIEERYPEKERAGWIIQEAEAQKVLANPTADSPLLQILALQRGKEETVLDLAVKIIENAKQWQRLYAWYTGQQQRICKEITAITTPEELENYIITYIPFA